MKKEAGMVIVQGTTKTWLGLRQQDGAIAPGVIQFAGAASQQLKKIMGEDITRVIEAIEIEGTDGRPGVSVAYSHIGNYARYTIAPLSGRVAGWRLNNDDDHNSQTIKPAASGVLIRRSYTDSSIEIRLQS